MAYCIRCNEEHIMPGVPRFCCYCGEPQPEQPTLEKAMATVEQENILRNHFGIPIEVIPNIQGCSPQFHQTQAVIAKKLNTVSRGPLLSFCARCGKPLPGITTF